MPKPMPIYHVCTSPVWPLPTVVQGSPKECVYHCGDKPTHWWKELGKELYTAEPKFRVLWEHECPECWTDFVVASDDECPYCGMERPQTRGDSGRMDEKSEEDHWTIDPYGKGVAWIHTCTDGEVWVFPPITKTCARCGVERPQTPGNSED